MSTESTPRLPGARAAVAVPATTANLGPGFDSFGAALGLRLVVTAVAPDGADHLVTTERTGLAAAGDVEVATDEHNLVWSSLVAACESMGWAVPDVALHVRTPIPFARGLGSSSAAIVGGIAIARLLAGADASVPGGDRDALVGDRDLGDLASGLEGHPDNVLPALHGGFVVAAPDTDGQLVVRTAPPPADTVPVVLVPPTQSLTSEARAVVPASLSRADVAVQAARAGHVVGGLLGAWPVDPRVAGDVLHEPPRVAALGVGGELLAAVRSAGHHAWLSGAGPSIAVAVPARGGVPDDLRVAAAAAGHTVLATTWDRQGARSCVPEGCGVSGMVGCVDCPLGSLR